MTFNLRNLYFVRYLYVLFRNMRSKILDLRYGIHTGVVAIDKAKSPLGAPKHADARGYEPVDYVLIRHIIHALRLDSGDIVYDIGCGMGRFVCVVACQNIRHACGVELDHALAKTARDNAASLRPAHCPIDIRHGDAADQDYRDGTVFFFFNPFGQSTMRAVLDQIRASLVVNPRPVRLVYYHPAEEAAMRDSGWLRLESKIESFWFRHPVHIWEG